MFSISPLVSPGALVAFETSVNFDVKMVSGAKNIIFGGQVSSLSLLRVAYNKTN